VIKTSSLCRFNLKFAGNAYTGIKLKFHFLAFLDVEQPNSSRFTFLVFLLFNVDQIFSNAKPLISKA
jgi:hypothetical protein